MSFASVWGFTLVGIDAVPVRVEAHARAGLPGVSIVGLPGAAVREARERVRSGAAISGFPLPTRRITINLSPGDVPKDGPGFDLPVALATLAACGYISEEVLRGVGAVGEVSLDGLVRPTRGMLPIAECAGRLGLTLLVVPVAGLAPAKAVEGITVLGARTLGEVVAAVRDPALRARLLERGRRWLLCRRAKLEQAPVEAVPDLAEVVGHPQAKRALEIVAAGAHHLLMVGSPGAGKTMLARRLPGILPPLSKEESLDVTRVWSAFGRQDAGHGLITERPFRAPHHTASRAAMVGGGILLRPGEVSLAHHGVLFLDELPEFSRDALEALRQPLEEGAVTISRRSGTSVFPAACAFVGAMNPCPCGYAGHPERECRCTGASLARYRSRLSGPLLDRMDVLIEVPPLSLEASRAGACGETSAEVRTRVAAARGFRHMREAAAAGRKGTGSSGRGRGETGGRSVALGGDASLDRDGRALLERALAVGGLSGRTFVRTVRLARTIADLDRSERVATEHVAEALSLRLDLRRLGLGP
jgi:magnesium chelatase family protein